MEMPSRIQLLSPLLISQIAAGEVIERPASVLKELLENSIDAGSTKIDVILEGGGIQLLSVQDNGGGIYREDLPLAVSQHATSKIHTINDLEGIASLGFRGEALASIASVSRLRLCSQPKDQDIGWQLSIVDSSEMPQIAPTACSFGTRVEVRDLFYNTPVRRRFLNSVKSELYHLEEVFKRIALSHFEIEFSIRHNQQKEKRYFSCNNAEQRIRRIRDLCGKIFSERALSIETATEDMTLRGWVDLNQQEPRSNVQLFFLNGRFVKDKILLHAVKQACLDMNILTGKGPSYLLYLEMNPNMVDVNVHPTKSEVRFRESRLIHAFLWHSLKEVFNHPSCSETLLDIAYTPSTRENNYQKDELQCNRNIDDFTTMPSSTNYWVLDNRLLFYFHEKNIWIIDIMRAENYFSKQLLLSVVQGEVLDKQLLIMPKKVIIQKNIEPFVFIKPLLERFGLEIEQLGLKELIIRTLPKRIHFRSVEDLVVSIFNKISSSSYVDDSIQKIMTILLDNILFSDSLSIEEGRKLIERVKKEYQSNAHILLKERVCKKVMIEEFMSLIL